MQATPEEYSALRKLADLLLAVRKEDKRMPRDPQRQVAAQAELRGYLFNSGLTIDIQEWPMTYIIDINVAEGNDTVDDYQLCRDAVPVPAHLQPREEPNGDGPD